MLDRLCNSIVLLWGWRRWSVALAAGAASALAMAPVHAFPILWLTLPIFVWLLDGSQDQTVKGSVRRLRPAMAVGWWFGFGYFLAGLWWIGLAFLVEADEFGALMPLAVVLLPAGLALFWAAAAGLSALFWGEGWRRIVVLAALFTLAEWLRGTVFTGFPWNTLGYGLAPNPTFMQAASVVGISGLTAISVLVFAAPALLAGDRVENRAGNRIFLGICLLLFAAVPVYGLLRLAPLAERSPQHADIRLRIVQPAIAQKDKWRPENRAKVFQSYLDLSNAATSPDRPGIVGVTHLIWPESAFPFILTRQPRALAAIADLLPPGTTLITGAARELAPAGGDQGRKVFNSIYVIDHRGEIRDAYDKVHLVPFGEYLPFRELLGLLGLRQMVKAPAGFSPGPGRRMMTAPGAPGFIPLICYEAIFPNEIIPTTISGGKSPKWLLNLTNDAWFGNTPGPSQHFHQARLRSVETGLPLVRAANTGISAIIDSYGRVQSNLKLGVRGLIDGTLPKAINTTIYSRFGDAPTLCILLILFGFAIFRRN